MQSHEAFGDRSECLGMITLLQSNRCHVIDAEAGRVLRREGAEWFDDGDVGRLIPNSR